MTEITITPGGRDDLQDVLNLVKELAVFEKEPEAVSATIAHYQECYDNGEIYTLMARRGDDLLGMALYYLTFSTWKGRMLYLEDLYVKDVYRNQGVGSLLFDAFIDQAKQRNCTMVKWQVLDWNKPAIEFYKRKGATIETDWWNGKMIF